MANRSVVEYFGKHERYSCGYCKGSDQCYSHGLWGHCLTPQDYQDLINRGWRRSGRYCYKPILNLTCCPQYTIRCEVSKFKLSKSQKKILKRMKNFLIHGQMKYDSLGERNSSFDEAHDVDMDCTHVPEINLDHKTLAKRDVDSFLDLDRKEKPCSDMPVEYKEESLSRDLCDDVKSTITTLLSESSITKEKTSCKGPDPNRPRCRKAKDIRRERHLQKLLKAGISAGEVSQVQQKQKCSEKTIEDFISDASVENPAHRLELRLISCNIKNPQFLKCFEQSYQLYQKYQMAIHKDLPDKCSKTQFTRFLVKNPFQLRLLKADPEDKFFVNTLPQSYELFRRYQMLIHHELEEECNQKIYEEFLIHTPFKFSDESLNSQTFYGSFHQQYWLDNKLIAVGVIDILPYCVSSVYFYYDPDYSFLSLGTYAALREMAFTRELYKKHCDLQYYYMGFYIHSCPKMKYKGSYSPSYLLCPETYLFKPLENCILKLNVSKYCRLEEDAKQEDSDGVVYIREVMVLYQRQAMNYAIYCTLNRPAEEEEEIREYASLIGRKCYRRILLYRSAEKE